MLISILLFGIGDAYFIHEFVIILFHLFILRPCIVLKSGCNSISNLGRWGRKLVIQLHRI